MHHHEAQTLASVSSDEAKPKAMTCPRMQKAEGGYISFFCCDEYHSFCCLLTVVLLLLLSSLSGGVAAAVALVV